MIRRSVSAVTVLLVLFSAIATGAAERFKSISMNEVEAHLQEQKKTTIHVFDANVESTRQNVGIIPGAKLLESSSSYDTKKVLPSDKTAKLVFYCANPMCLASHHAADRAIDAGYKDVNVMKDGIYGWKKAGKALAKTETASSNTAPSAVPQEPQSIEPKQAYEMAKSGQAVIVDLRTEEERHEVIDGSLWLPMTKINDPKAWSEFKASLKGKTPIFHCAGGYRSKKVAEKLSAEGEKGLYFKGPDQWKSAGLPLTKGPAN